MAFLKYGILILTSAKSFSQNGIIGSEFSSGGNNADIIDFSQGAEDSRIATLTTNDSGDRFLRLVTRWAGNDNQWGPSSITDDLEVSITSVIDDVIQNSTNKAYEILNANIAFNYVF